MAAGFGRAALLLALEAIGVRGGEVAVPDFICAQVPAAVREARGVPAFYRIRRDLHVDGESFQAALSRSPRAAVVVHYYGRKLAEVDVLSRLCRRRGVPLVEDCALALGAGSGGHRVGRFGDVAIFSFTKSDWCFGGGMAASDSDALLTAMRELRAEKLRSARRLLRWYGILHRADFAANRPRWSRSATWAGRCLNTLSGVRAANFYDAGTCNAKMTDFSARRASRIVEALETDVLRRQRIAEDLQALLGTTTGTHFEPGACAENKPSVSGAFFLLESALGGAPEMVERADREGVTLRLSWPAYQPQDPEQRSAELAWLADHLLILEVHPGLSRREVSRIVRTLELLIC